MVFGKQCVMISGTIMMQKLYAHNLGIKVMVSVRSTADYHTLSMFFNLGARAFWHAHFGQGSGLILEEIICFGHEMSLTACHYHDENDGYCRHVEDAGVQCCK
jgi:hypothetical protein